MTPEQARLYHMAILLHIASSQHDSEPQLAFVVALHARLEQELRREQERGQCHWSRRSLLIISRAAAASLIMGAVMVQSIDQAPAYTTPVPLATPSSEWLPSSIPAWCLSEMSSFSPVFPIHLLERDTTPGCWRIKT